MIDNEIEQLQLLCNEFSSRLCAIDLKGFDYKNLNTNNNESSELLFNVERNKVQYISFLKKHNYHNLIAHILMYCDLSDSLKDACKPFVSDSDFEHIKREFAKAQQHLSYQWREVGLVFHAPEFFIDIVLFPISQFHNQIVNTMDTFGIANKEYNNLNLYLDALTPSFFTQFSQYWVAEKLGKLEFKNNDNGIVIVV